MGALPDGLQDGGTRYVTGLDGLPVESRQRAMGPVLYDLRDQLGSTRGVVDTAGVVVASYAYDAYGVRHARSGTVVTPFGFAGQHTDAETGLLYLRTRSYDPAAAQFLSVDPLLSMTGQPYVYADGDPLNQVDLAGLCSLPWWVRAGVGVAGVAGLVI